MKNKKIKIDPKHLGIPNICFSLTDKDDKREKKLTKQRLKRGFDDSEMWSLDSTIASFIVPRLKEFIKAHKEHIVNINNFVEDCEEFLWAMECKSKDCTDSDDRYLKALTLFPKIFDGLWW